MSTASRIEYSEKYADETHEYRYVNGPIAGTKGIRYPVSRVVSPLARLSHVILPKELAKTLPISRLLTEAEWRGIGVQQSRGWQHYAIHR
jgi:cyclin-dependent kinase regulatory subunit CKS1